MCNKNASSLKICLLIRIQSSKQLLLKTFKVFSPDYIWQEVNKNKGSSYGDIITLNPSPVYLLKLIKELSTHQVSKDASCLSLPNHKHTSMSCNKTNFNQQICLFCMKSL